MLMNSAGNYVVLLFTRELIEVDCITRNPYSEVGILFGVSLRIQQSFAVEYVYVEVIALVADITVNDVYKVFYLYALLFAERLGRH